MFRIIYSLDFSDYYFLIRFRLADIWGRRPYSDMISLSEGRYGQFSS